MEKKKIIALFLTLEGKHSFIINCAIGSQFFFFLISPYQTGEVNFYREFGEKFYFCLSSGIDARYQIFSKTFPDL